MAEKPFTPTSLGMIGVIPSPPSSENESEPTPVFVVSQVQAQQAKEGQKEPVLRELSWDEQQKQTRNKRVRQRRVTIELG